MAELWRQSTLIGAISSIIARYARGLDEDRALLAGLVSNIGVLPIIAYIEKYPRLASNKAVLQQMTEAHATTVGTMVLQRWDFDKDMIAVVSETNNWLRDNKPEADYCDVVILAKYYVEADKAGEGNLPEINDIPAFRKISQGRLGESMGPKLLETARGEIEEIQKILQG
jgi:HD-like signal output (HDOD) protein